MLIHTATNAELVERAQRVIPGGVNSVNRVLPWPFVPAEAHGATIRDAEGRTYLDYHAAFGPIILGHNHPQVNAAVHEAMSKLDIIGVGDVVAVSVYEPGGALFGSRGPMGASSGRETFPAQPVDREGRIAVPYAGRVRIAGLNTAEAADAIRRAINLAGTTGTPYLFANQAGTSPSALLTLVTKVIFSPLVLCWGCGNSQRASTQ
jgi:hypothetical protein